MDTQMDNQRIIEELKVELDRLTRQCNRWKWLHDELLTQVIKHDEKHHGLTASEVEQGRDSPPGCDPKGGEGIRRAEQLLCACGHLRMNHHDGGQRALTSNTWCLECVCERFTAHE